MSKSCALCYTTSVALTFLRLGTGCIRKIVTETAISLCYSIRFITSYALGGLCAILCTGCIVIVYVVSKAMTKSYALCYSTTVTLTFLCRPTGRICEIVSELTVNVCYRIGFIASVTLGGLCAILGTGCISVGYVICEGMLRAGKNKSAA